MILKFKSKLKYGPKQIADRYIKNPRIKIFKNGLFKEKGEERICLYLFYIYLYFIHPYLIFTSLHNCRILVYT